MQHQSPPPRLSRLWFSATGILPQVLICVGVLASPLLMPYDALKPLPPQFERALGRTRLLPLKSASADDLRRVLDQLWGAGTDAVPRLAPNRLPEDLEQLPVADRKRVFFRALLPHVLDHNDRILAERTRLLGLYRRLRGGEKLTSPDLRFLGRLADRYRLGVEIAEPAEQVQTLLRRVDIVPPSIALAQAAIESAWGTSRFSRVGNNLFGQWLFHRSRGIAPLQRPDGANYSVARFSSLGDSVDAYLRNLNGFHAYEEFRHLRQQMRNARQPLDPYRLTAGLLRYSVRREAYVREVRSVIRSNRLTRFDQARFAAPGERSNWAL